MHPFHTLPKFAISTDQSYRFVPCFRSWSLFVPPSVVERFYDAGLEAVGHWLKSDRRSFQPPPRFPKQRFFRSTWERHIKTWNVNVENLMKIYLLISFFLGWRSWWFLLKWWFREFVDFWGDGMTLDGPSLREIDSAAGQEKRDCTHQFQVSWIGG